MSEPQWITREGLCRRIRIEVSNLEDGDRAWWAAHHVEPFVTARDGDSQFVVAVSGDRSLVFFDNYGSFGEYAPRLWERSLTLYRDLPDAVQCLATSDRISLLLSETASRLFQLGVWEQSDSFTKWRALHVLGAFKADAAVAVPKLIEIMSNEELRGGLNELAVMTLSKIGPKAAEAVPKLIEMAKLDTANARAWCLQTFSSIGPAAAPAVPLLIDLLLKKVSFDPDPCYVSMAADALGNIGAIEALPALLQVLREAEDSNDTYSIIEALGKFGPKAAEAEPFLVSLILGHTVVNGYYSQEELRGIAREVLIRIGKPVPVDPPPS